MDICESLVFSVVLGSLDHLNSNIRMNKGGNYDENWPGVDNEVSEIEKFKQSTFSCSKEYKVYEREYKSKYK